MRDETLRFDFRRFLVEARNAADHTQTTLAEAVGVSATKISDYERGVYLPSIETLYRIAEALDVSIDALLGREEYPKKEYRL